MQSSVQLGLGPILRSLKLSAALQGCDFRHSVPTVPSANLAAFNFSSVGCCPHYFQKTVTAQCMKRKAQLKRRNVETPRMYFMPAAAKTDKPSKKTGEAKQSTLTCKFSVPFLATTQQQQYTMAL